MPRTGASVEGCWVDSWTCSAHQLDLMLSSGSGDRTSHARLSINGRFVLVQGSEEQWLDVQGPKRDLAPVLDLHDHRVFECRASYDGMLIVGFDAPVGLCVPPSEEYAAWELMTLEERVVCSAGGELSVGW